MLKSLKVAKWWKDDEGWWKWWRMMKDDEGWMNNDENDEGWWRLNDEEWWFQVVEGFCRKTNRQTDICECRVAFETDKTIFNRNKMWTQIQSINFVVFQMYKTMQWGRTHGYCWYCETKLLGKGWIICDQPSQCWYWQTLTRY